MKNKSVLAIIAMAILATTVAVVSCKKEKHVQISNKEEQSSLCFDNMDEYLISFKKKLISAQKGSETLALNKPSATWGTCLTSTWAMPIILPM